MEESKYDLAKKLINATNDFLPIKTYTFNQDKDIRDEVFIKYLEVAEDILQLINAKSK